MKLPFGYMVIKLKKKYRHLADVDLALFRRTKNSDGSISEKFIFPRVTPWKRTKDDKEL